VIVVPLDGSAPARSLTEKYDLHTAADVINDMGSPETMPPTWSPDSQRLYFPVALHGCSQLMSVDLAGENLETLVAGNGAVGSFGFDRAHTTLAYTFGSITDPFQVRVRSLADVQERQITHVNQELLAQLELGEVEERWSMAQMATIWG
jgi:dipeptidyl aminopeptidase/acylaminoacyl peptidase